jgi:hypothetical protein
VFVCGREREGREGGGRESVSERVHVSGSAELSSRYPPAGVP